MTKNSMIKDALMETDKCITKFTNSLFPLNQVRNAICINEKDTNVKYLKSVISNLDDFYAPTKGKLVMDIIIRSFLAANQQFCFWYDKTTPTKRTKYTSGGINKLVQQPYSNYSELRDALRKYIMDEAITLRKERIEILNASFDMILAIDTGSEDYGQWIGFLYKFSMFHNDPFRKKANYFIMDLIRYYRYVKDNKYIYEGVVNNHLEYRERFLQFMERDVIPYHMPAIDYQIPKSLRGLKIIDFGQHINSLIDRGIIIEEDSTEELIIRVVSYKALGIIQRKYASDGMTHEMIDANLFFGRDGFTNNIHLCKTTYY